MLILEGPVAVIRLVFLGNFDSKGSSAKRSKKSTKQTNTPANARSGNNPNSTKNCVTLKNTRDRGA